MDSKTIPKIGAVLAAAGIWLSASANAALFQIIENDDNGPDISAQLKISIVAGTQGAAVDFLIQNLGPTASAIESVYIYGKDTGLGKSNPWLTSTPYDDSTKTGVSFGEVQGNGNLPGYNIEAAFAADADSPPDKKGIDPGEWLRLHFTSLPPENPTVASLNALLESGALRVGMHVISVGPNEVSQTYLTPVPEPTTLIASALLLLPFGLSTLRALRNRKA